MSDSELFFALLRVSAAQVLRAAGLTTAKPSVLDAFTDIFARYLMLLGTTTRDFAESAGRPTAELEDVRTAMEHVGLVRPLNVFDDPDEDDTRGIDALVEWFRGPQASEMRRVAGFGGGEDGTAVITGVPGATMEGMKNDEWMAVIKKLSEKKAMSNSI
ncbi:hypothetical protein EDC01DRAFT_132210 [Geopyxis carbonaria]|nr:hypothetical protein EDC01DRAFT_132210 [Geopyxis carbonaria]